ncbi:MAG TPA: 4Fe-4S dicluster domain-containing protein [Armatimonadota bacterium]|nr:4Fe-4S dicluster domain-containing protein [Armatimonadota bacterium]
MIQRFSMPASGLPEAAARLLGEFDEFIAPVCDRYDETFFAPVTDAREIPRAWGNSLLSPVAYLYPPRETLFGFELVEGEPPRLNSALDERSRAIFGIRPCDTHAIEYLDRFLLEGEFADTQYQARRRNTKLITVACAEPAAETCWCSCSDAGPVAEGGFDAQLTRVGNLMLVEVAESGMFVAEAWGDLLQPAGEELLNRRDQQAEAVRQELETRAHLASAMRRVTAGALPDEFWQELGARCMGCAGCSLVCPKCTCFNVVDEMLTDTTGRRERIKDSCRLAGYSLEASGHNPRATPADRAKRWSYHKLSHHYFERNEDHGCVGCGRCVAVCMGGVDMVYAATRAREADRDATPAAADQR